MSITGISAVGSNATTVPSEIALSANKSSALPDQINVDKHNIVVESAKLNPPPQPSENDVKSAVNAINKYLAPNSNDIQFIQDKDSGATLVQIVDTATGTVVRQIPTQQIVDISKDLAKLQGLLVKEKA